MSRKLIQLFACVAAAGAWVLALLVVQHWLAAVFAAVLMFLAFFGDLMLASLMSTWRYARLKRAGFDNSCTWDMSQRGWPWGTRDYATACLTYTVEKYSYAKGARTILPAVVAFTDDHDDQHEYIRMYEGARKRGRDGRRMQERFWEEVTTSSYSREDAAHLIEEAGFETALHAVKLDLPVEYALTLA